MQPWFIALSLTGGALFALRISGRAVLRKSPMLFIPLTAAAGINVLFNHRGVTVLGHFPSGNPFTAESLAYGAAAGTMLCGALIWFYCFGKLFTADRLMCLTGKAFPALTVIFSMTVRFIPLFARRFREISAAQSQLGFGISSGGPMKRLRNLARIFSILITRSLEESVVTADSMKSRGYGLRGRSSFSLFRFTGRDAAVLTVTVLLAGYVIGSEIAGVGEFRFYPRIVSAETDVWSVMQLCAFGALCLLPNIYDIPEDAKWRSLRSKI